MESLRDGPNRPVSSATLSLVSWGEINLSEYQSTPPLSNASKPPSWTSTPIVKRGDSGSEDLASDRETSLLDTLRVGGKIWVEKPAGVGLGRSDMIERFLGRMEERYRRLAE